MPGAAEAAGLPPLDAEEMSEGQGGASKRRESGMRDKAQITLYG